MIRCKLYISVVNKFISFRYRGFLRLKHSFHCITLTLFFIKWLLYKDRIAEPRTGGATFYILLPLAFPIHYILFFPVSLQIVHAYNLPNNLLF